MLPDPGCYEERDRVTGREGTGLAAGLLAIGLGLIWHTQTIFLVIGVVLAAVTVIALARRQLAFRADHAGILFPGRPDRLTARHGPARCAAARGRGSPGWQAAGRPTADVGVWSRERPGSACGN